nr:reverse transcriptase domain-containing protein [Tanacetum cinerariifolium]
MHPKSASMTQVAIRRMIKDSVDAAIAAEWSRQANVRNDASGSRLVRGQDATPAIRECTFAWFMKCNPAIFHGVEGAVELRRWFEKAESVFEISECAEARRMVEPERVKVDAYIRGLTNNIKGEVTSSKPVDLNEAIRMAHKFTEQKSQARDARILKEKSESRRAFKVEIVVCTIKCGKVRHKARNRCPKKVQQEEVREARGRAYAIKDAEPQGPNVVTGTFLLNNHYDFVLFNLGSDRSFVDTRFSAMLDTDSIKLGASYEVELDHGRVTSMNTILKGCTLNLCWDERNS